MLGALAVSLIVVALLVGAAVFHFMRERLQIPAILNIPGAFLTFSAVVQFTSWLSMDLFVSASAIPPPVVPWYQWLVFLGLAGAWYVAAHLITVALRRLLAEKAP